MRKRMLPMLLAVPVLALAATLTATPPAPQMLYHAQGRTLHATLTAAHHKRLGAGPWNIWETNGTQAVGADTLSAGDQVREVAHPGRTMTWVQEGTTGDGTPYGEWQFSNGNYMAANSNCTAVTIKSSKTSTGTVWFWDVFAGGSDQVIESRHCGNGQDLAGHNHNGDQFVICAFGAAGCFEAMTLHTP